MDKLQKLNEDYIKNVLPFLFKSTTVQGVREYLSGFGSGKYDISLGIRTLLNFAPEYRPKSTNYIHFTSLKALHSIINESSFRMYNLQNVNDPNEFSFIASNFGYSENQLNSFKKRTYVLSLCNSSLLLSDDVLNLWRLYGSDGFGCVIELEFKNNINQSSDIKLANVIYTNPKYSDFFEENKKFEDRNSVKTDLKKLIQIPACLHKKPIYKHEKESRLIKEDGYEEIPHRTIKDDSKYGYDFNGRGEIVSYYKIKLYNTDGINPEIRIKRIQLGFKTNPNRLNEYRDHINSLFLGIQTQKGKRFELPEIEISPLSGDYR